MPNRACLCGSSTCTHRRRSRPKRPGVYGADHQERRRRMLEGMRNGTIPAVCAFCGGGPKLGMEWSWEADHRIPVARNGGPEVRPAHMRCNRRAGAQLAAQLKREAADRRAQARIEETAQLLRGRSA